MPDLLKHDYVFVTRQGLTELEEIIERRASNYFRNRKVPTEASIERSQNKLTDHCEREIIRRIIDAEAFENDDTPL